MSTATQPRKIAFVGTYLPRQCGIGTFTHDLCRAVAGEFPGVESYVVPVNDTAETYGYPEAVRANARHALDALTEMIETRAFPFVES